jgi:DNA (cytosine-5)-methyltransferase 1
MKAVTTDRWLSTSDLCQYLSVSNDTLYRWIQNNDFPARKIGKRWKALRGQVDTWISHRGNDNLETALSLPSPSYGNLLPWSVFSNPLPSKEDCAYTHFSLFSGCGGIDLGFRQAGFLTVFANDIDGDACSTYSENLGGITIGDIREIKLPSIKKLDVLTAGFPCQPFSNAGSRKGFLDERGSLFMSAIDAVEYLKPKVVLFENVRGLLSTKHEGNLLIETICEKLDQLGYSVIFSLIDASKHNVAQKRLRVFIIGVNKRKTKGVFAFPQIVARDDLSLKNIVLNVPVSMPNQDELMQLNPQAISLGKKIPEGGSWKSIPYDELPDRLKKIRDNIERYHWPNFYRKYHRDEISGTITAAFKPENAGVWHPTEGSIFSVREIARIQSFPDWFVFNGRSIKSKYQQIGNAVPPRLAYEMACQIIKVLKGQNLLVDVQPIYFSDFKKLSRPIRERDQNIIYK